jgi:6-pyruvoyltetrahydropterin/6-carboxytetrahydropterin synthase
MTYGICLTKEIEAAHFLTLYKGKPETVHGHTWKVEVSIEGPLGPEDYVADFVEIDHFFCELNRPFDHGSFNEHPYFKEGNKSPTTENIARYFFDSFANHLKSNQSLKVVRVNVWEGPRNYAYVRS